MLSYLVGVHPQCPTERGTPTPNRQEYFSVHESAIHGKGLYSEIDFEAGNVLFELAGTKVSHDYDPKLSIENPNWIGIGYGSWLQLNDGDPAVFINHSCNPNVVINDRMQIVTIAPIKAHTELLLDYSTTELDPFWQMECKCGGPCCRKVLKSFQFLPYDLKMKYNQYIAPVFSVIGEEMIMEHTIE